MPGIEKDLCRHSGMEQSTVEEAVLSPRDDEDRMVSAMERAIFTALVSLGAYQIRWRDHIGRFLRLLFPSFDALKNASALPTKSASSHPRFLSFVRLLIQCRFTRSAASAQPTMRSNQVAIHSSVCRYPFTSFLRHPQSESSP